jgi:UDP-N-acetyl-D-mannosaminuronic acid transferase (WecB/TagA/CpsF family)
MNDGMSVVFFRVLPVSSTNKSDGHDITEILLKVAIKTLNIILKGSF